MNPKFALFGAFLCTGAFAGDYQPDPAVEYTFAAAVETPASSTAAEDRWVDHTLSYEQWLAGRRLPTRGRCRDRDVDDRSPQPGNGETPGPRARPP